MAVTALASAYSLGQTHRVVDAVTAAQSASLTGPLRAAPASECGVFNLTACMHEAAGSFLSSWVTAVLNWALDLLATSLLSSPQLDANPAVEQLWSQSRTIMITVYALLILTAGIVVMAHQSLQTHYTIKEILPRVIIGFLAANLSWEIAGKSIQLANALSQAVVGDNLDPRGVGQFLERAIILDHFDLNLDFFRSLLMLVLAIILVGILLTYIVRVALLVLLVIAAPLFLMCHALPQTEAVAFFWWKAFAGVLAIQVGQSLVFIAAVKLFLQPGGIILFA